MVHALGYRRFSQMLLALLFGVPCMIAFAEVKIHREFASISSDLETLPTIQERARKKLIQGRNMNTRSVLLDQTVGIDPPETMIANAIAEDDLDDIDAFPIVLAAPTN